MWGGVRSWTNLLGMKLVSRKSTEDDKKRPAFLTVDTKTKDQIKLKCNSVKANLRWDQMDDGPQHSTEGDGIINLRKIRLKGKLKSRWLRWVTCTNLDTVLAKWIVFFYDSYGTTVLSTCEKEIWSRGTEETRVTILFSYSIQVLVLTTNYWSFQPCHDCFSIFSLHLCS